MIALLTYWRFYGVELSSVYGYVAQQDVVHTETFGNISDIHSVVWDFFGLINKLVVPHSIALVKVFGLVFVVLSLILIPNVLDYMTGQRFWGFLCVFLVALSPFSVVAAASGGPAAVAAVITVLFLAALYRNEYVLAGILSAIAMAANLPGLVMFLITILDLLQNLAERKTVVRHVIFSSAGFLGVGLILFIFSTYSASVRVYSVPIAASDLTWKFIGFSPLCAVNVLNVAGVVYLIARKRYDFYKTHFPALMLWVTCCTLCAALPSTTNFLTAMVASSILSMFFLQGFASIMPEPETPSARWNLKLVPSVTIVFVFAAIVLFSESYGNNKFVRDIIIPDGAERTEAVNKVAEAIAAAGGDFQIASNFSAAELSVKLGKKVLDVHENIPPISGLILPGENMGVSDGKMIYVAQLPSMVDTSFEGCKTLLKVNYSEDGEVHLVQVLECEKNNE